MHVPQRLIVCFRAKTGEAVATPELTEDFVALKGHMSDLPVFDILQEGGIRNGLIRAWAGAEAVENTQQYDSDYNPKDDIFGKIVQK